jgi:hypothetical protein
MWKQGGREGLANLDRMFVQFQQGLSFVFRFMGDPSCFIDLMIRIFGTQSIVPESESRDGRSRSVTAPQLWIWGSVGGGVVFLVLGRGRACDD